MARIYTKTGDRGYTGLFGGDRVLKSNPRIEAYGTIDELNSWLGLINSFRDKSIPAELFRDVQNNLFTIGSLLASTSKKQENVPSLETSSINSLESAIDKMEENLPALTSFILPGGNVMAGYCHLARTVCRRAERRIVALEGVEGLEMIIQYINRLSDFLFVLARKVVHDAGDTEIQWKPKV
ncbi:MAG: cob(I)yrinic acid a,c-diamide adenosyltransferase [Cyclobacteriaceae bacterium]|nr:cob(I)yrinic acid a,c-diamide adenosyltransferase [Cyclobacteriaceae bacterium]